MVATSVVSLQQSMGRVLEGEALVMVPRRAAAATPPAKAAAAE